MTNNDILRRIRYAFDFRDSEVVSLFGLAEYEVTQEQVSGWLSRDDAPAFQECSDTELAAFLNGLINERRGKKEGAQPRPEKRLTNNIILVKLRIALDLKSEDIMAILGLAELHIGKHELSAFFRKPGNKHYRECKDQVMRKFLEGVQLRYRDGR